MAFYFNRLLSSVCDFYFPEDDPDKSGKVLLENYDQLFPYCIIFANPTCYHRFDFLIDIPVPFILITGKGDETIPFYKPSEYQPRGFKILENPNLIRWFGNNIDHNHEKLTCLPIGLPRNIPWIGFDRESYMGWYKNYVTYDNLLVSFPFKQLIKPKEKLLYVRHKIGNNIPCVAMHQYVDVRKKWNEVLAQRGFEVFENLIPWNIYMEELTQHQFCLSPPGRGIDCFRTWEALNAGVIPIVLKTSDIMCEMYKDLPIVVIEDIKEVTKEFLQNKFEEIKTEFNSYNFFKLSQKYWFDLILKEKREYIKYSRGLVSMNKIINSNTCNHMFQYAFLKAISLEKNIPIFCQEKWVELEPFKKIKFDTPPKIKLTINSIYENGFRYDPTLKDKIMENKKNELNGYFQSPKYFEKYEREIKDSFELDDNLINTTNEAYNEFTKENKELCGFHIRLADVRHTPDFVYSLPTVDFVTRAIALIKEKKENIRFLVCSNDIRYCKLLFQHLFPLDTIFFHKGKFEDFSMLSRCDHNIVTAGSYGWWSAYLNKNSNKIIIAMHPIFSLCGEYRGVDESDYYPKDWIVLEN